MSTAFQEGEENENDGKLRKKLEIQFKDIEKLSFVKQRQEITLGR